MKSPKAQPIKFEIAEVLGKDWRINGNIALADESDLCKVLQGA
jgi:hypothetical protein